MSSVHPFRLEDINTIPDPKKEYPVYRIILQQIIYSEGVTYVMKLCICGEFELLEKYLQENPLEVDKSTSFLGHTPLSLIAKNANDPYFFETPEIAEQTAKILIKYNSNLNHRTYDRDLGQTIIMICISSKTTNILKILLDAGADVNSRYDNSDTILHKLLVFPTEGKYTFDIMKMILDAKADPNIQSDYGGTTLMLAARNSKCSEYGNDIVRMLLDAKADPNTKAANGNTALILSVKDAYNCSTPDTVKILLDAKANPDMENKEGVHIIEFVDREKGGDLTKLLLGYIKEKAAREAVAKFVGIGCMEMSVPIEIISDITKKV